MPSLGINFLSEIGLMFAVGILKVRPLPSSPGSALRAAAARAGGGRRRARPGRAGLQRLRTGVRPRGKARGGGQGHGHAGGARLGS